MANGFRDALDASFSLPAPSLLAEQGWDVLVYTGNARPPDWWLDECGRLGVTVTFIQETDPNAAQGGYDRARIDVPFAERRSRDGAAICYVVSDGNLSSPPYGLPTIRGYGQGVADLSSRQFFFYGNRGTVDTANEGAALSPGNVRNMGAATKGGWVPETWFADPARDLLVQHVGYYTDAGGVCDRNTVHRAYAGGAMPAELDEEDDMPRVFISKQSAAPGTPEAGVWEQAGNTRRWVQPDEWNAIGYVAGLEGRPAPSAIPASDQWWDTLPDVATLAGGTIVVPGDGGLSDEERAVMSTTRDGLRAQADTLDAYLASH